VVTSKAPRNDWFLLPRTIRQLMMAVALSGLVLWAAGPRRGGVANRPGRLGGRVPGAAMHQSAVLSQANPAWPGDPGILTAAPAGIDDRFVVAAPEGIDDRFVVVPQHFPTRAAVPARVARDRPVVPAPR
jgi:hypothetical protein